MKKKLLLSLVILAIIFGVGTFIVINNSKESKNISNAIKDNTNNQSTESLSPNNKEELIDSDNLDIKEENTETEENENRLNDNRTEENNTQTNKVKTDNSKTEPKKEERQTVKKDEQVNSKTEPKKEERQTVKKDEQVNSNTEQPIEDKNIKSINFTNSYITKEVYGTLSYNGGSNITISSQQYSTITIDEIKKLNPIVISPSNSKYENITYTTSNKNIAEFVGDELRIYTYGETDIIATADNGVSGSFKIKFISSLSVKIHAMRKLDYTSRKTPFPYYIGFQFNLSSITCGKAQQYDLNLTLYKDNQKVENVKFTNDYKSKRYVIYTLEDVAGNYYVEYSITDKCNNNTKSGKSRTIYISTDEEQLYVA